MTNSYHPLGEEEKINPQPKSQSLNNHPAASSVDPAFLDWAKQKEMVRPGEDGSLPAMDRGGYGIQSLVWGGPMQTGSNEASVPAKRDMDDRAHGQAEVVGGSGTEGHGEVRERKRDKLKRIFGDGAYQRRIAREFGS